jgi:hypothetical protein
MMIASADKRRSNMFFSCGPDQEERGRIPAKFYRKDECGYYFKLTAPLFVHLRDESGKAKLTQVTGPVIFIADGDAFWGGEGVKNYRSKVIENPTYRSLMGAAKSSQAKTRDYHHAFIESAYFKGYEEIDGRPVMILQMSFGS